MPRGILPQCLLLAVLMQGKDVDDLLGSYHLYVNRMCRVSIRSSQTALLPSITKAEVERGYINNPSARPAVFLFLPEDRYTPL